ncbi:unnamed protein product [Moneuplotes crassus]|uniref:Uncharacterized protein n=1 Tax=Euplotes crassus TaxID=5936 RepID=A0AAD1X486_EUPCR|nr:unnamed protein product [Moneuplotes crassus]
MESSGSGDERDIQIEIKDFETCKIRSLGFLPFVTKTLKYYGYLAECYLLMSQLNRYSRLFWHKYEYAMMNMADIEREDDVKKSIRFESEKETQLFLSPAMKYRLYYIYLSEEQHLVKFMSALDILLERKANPKEAKTFIEKTRISMKYEDLIDCRFCMLPQSKRGKKSLDKLKISVLDNQLKPLLHKIKLHDHSKYRSLVYITSKRIPYIPNLDFVNRHTIPFLTSNLGESFIKKVDYIYSSGDVKQYEDVFQRGTFRLEHLEINSSFCYELIDYLLKIKTDEEHRNNEGYFINPLLAESVKCVSISDLDGRNDAINNEAREMTEIFEKLFKLFVSFDTCNFDIKLMRGTKYGFKLDFLDFDGKYISELKDRPSFQNCNILNSKITLGCIDKIPIGRSVTLSSYSCYIEANSCSINVNLFPNSMVKIIYPKEKNKTQYWYTRDILCEKFSIKIEPYCEEIHNVMFQKVEGRSSLRKGDKQCFKMYVSATSFKIKTSRPEDPKSRETKFKGSKEVMEYVDFYKSVFCFDENCIQDASFFGSDYQVVPVLKDEFSHLEGSLVWKKVMRQKQVMEQVKKSDMIDQWGKYLVVPLY